MAATSAPYGLRPVKMLGNRPQSAGVTLYRIASAYATNIFFGDVVKPVAGGVIEKDAGTTTATPVGVFLGCEYETTDGGLYHRQYWPASTAVKTGTFAWAYVADDPDQLFEVQANTSLDITAMGINAALVQGAGSTATGNSGVSIGSINTTATLPIRIIDYVDRPGSALGDAFTDVIVKFNTHQHYTALGI